MNAVPPALSAKNITPELYAAVVNNLAVSQMNCLHLQQKCEALQRRLDELEGKQ